MSEREKMHKNLGLFEVFSIATGAMISSGLFVLPAIVFEIAGPGIIVAYILGGIFMIPAMLSKAELATAMPKSGGTYFFINRSLGPLLGTFAGLANWFSIALKGSFALVGMGAFLQLMMPDISSFHIKLAALCLVILFTLLNLLSVKESGRLQIIMVVLLIVSLLYFIISGLQEVEVNRFSPFIPEGYDSVLAAAGMIFISYGGLTKVASLAEEVKNPGKNIPAGMFLSFFVVNLLYVFSVFVVVGVLSPESITGSYTPLSVAANFTQGKVGLVIISIGAILSFATTGNASIMSSSRIPLAMSRDNLLPLFLSKVSRKHGVPWVSIVLTGLFMSVVIISLDLKELVKVASAMMLTLFFLINLSVIFMRESRITTYTPQFKSPLYPGLQIFGMLASILLIAEMGKLPLLISSGFFLLSVLWYFIYRKRGSTQKSALIRIVERVTDRSIAGTGLHEELTQIIFERDNIVEDRFDLILRNASIIDIDENISHRELFDLIAEAFENKLDLSKEDILQKLKDREDVSTTVLNPDLAIPHLIFPGQTGFEMVILRARKGVEFSPEFGSVKMIFSLAGAQDERNFHLKALMAIAQIVQSPDFKKRWDQARSTEELRNLILTTKRKR